MPLLVSLQLPLVANAVKVGQMRSPPVLHINATTPTFTAKTLASSMPATTLPHATAPRGQRAIVKVRHHVGRRARNTFLEQSVERSVDRCSGTIAGPIPPSSVLTRAAVPRASAPTQSRRHPLSLALLHRVHTVVARSVEGKTGRAVHGPRRIVARPRPTAAVTTGRAMWRAARPSHASAVARRSTFTTPTSSATL